MTPTVLMVFGATGDLMRRKLIPALFHLYTQGHLPEMMHVLGFSRQQLSDEAFQKQVEDISKSREFSKLFSYQSGTFEDAAAYTEAAKRLGMQDKQWRTCANKLFYLAVPPQHYKTIFQNLADSGLTKPCGPDEGWTRVIVEKPFGKDLATAQELDEMLGNLFQEEQIFRIDHYLGKETARNILAFRFSNTFLEPSWNNRSIQSISVQFPEQDTIGTRGGFYEGIGALRDVGQNHMLQLLALFLMSNPGTFDAGSIRRERTKILEALEAMDAEDIIQKTMRGQYEGYTQEKGVEKTSSTETYFRIQTHVNIPRWHGVPIVLEHGKALAESKFEIVAQFRHKTPCLCPPGKHYTNELRYRIQPNEGVSMSLWAKRPGGDMVIEEKDFSFDYHEAFAGDNFLDAYAKLLLDAFAGDQTLFVSTEEITASWKFIDPIIRAWQEDAVPLLPYSVGTHPAPRKGGATEGSSPNKTIGFIGLGKMGSNMVLRLLDHGWNVHASDPDKAAREIGAAKGAQVYSSAIKVIKKLPSGRLVWVMVPHQVVDDVLEEILPHLQKGDTVIDGGNSHYKKSIKRAEKLAARGVFFLDAGVSGGPSGAREGACLMIGGEHEAYKKYVGLFSDLAVAGGYGYMGKSGAGHFVKMVHNGIEYGMMQAIAEGFTIMKEHPINLETVASLYNHGSVIESSLIGWLKDAYDKYGQELQEVTGSVAHSGEGQWTVQAAQELGIPAPIIEGALQFRIESQENPSYTGQVVSALRNMFGGHDVKK